MTVAKAISQSELRELVSSINVWKRGDEIAPHKPLLLLIAFARLLDGKPRLVKFTEIADRLGQLIADFGASRQSVHPEYPFWRLQNDGLWEIPNGSVMRLRKGSTDPPKSEFLKHDIAGGLPEPVYKLLSQDRTLVFELTDLLLTRHFSPGQHSSIRTAVGLPGE